MFSEDSGLQNGNSLLTGAESRVTLRLLLDNKDKNNNNDNNNNKLLIYSWC